MKKEKTRDERMEELINLKNAIFMPGNDEKFDHIIRLLINYENRINDLEDEVDALADEVEILSDIDQ